MDGPGKNIEPSTSKELEEVAEVDDDIDMKEIEIVQLDEILSSPGEAKMLDYERQMFLDCVYNDGLVICGK
jgi:hypothetical protein